MIESGKFFGPGSFESKPKVPYEKLNTPFKKESYEDGPLDKQSLDEKELLQKNSEDDYYKKIIEELRSKKRGGADIHLSQIKIADLSQEALELYKGFDEDRITEQQIRSFISGKSAGDNEYNFGAMLLNWSIDKAEKKRAEEKEILKKGAEEKIRELKDNPHIAAKIENINLSALHKLDYEVILGKRSFIDYENKLKEYFRNKPKEEVKNNIKPEDYARLQYYCFISELLNNKPTSPDNFLSNL